MLLKGLIINIGVYSLPRHLRRYVEHVSHLALIPFLLSGLIFFTITVTPAAATAAGSNDPVALVPINFSDLAQKISPSVVNIRTVKVPKDNGRVFRHFKKGPFGQENPMEEFFKRFFNDDFNRNFKQRSLGSGFIITEDGYIVTNNHVVDEAETIEVVLKDERKFDAEIVGRDQTTDLALIKIKSGSNMPAVKLGDSSQLKVGQWVVAIGNPFGLENTVTAGIVSAKGRVIGSGPYDDFIQTDASINPGNSGGPLINIQGEVVGINTAIVASGQGIGFAIPINLAKGVIDQLKSSGEVTRGWLGVTIQDLPEDLAEYWDIKERKGALVISVIEGDPADQAGIKPKDIILEVNGTPIGDSRELTNFVKDIGVGQKAEVKIFREGKTQTLAVIVGKRPQNATIAGSQPLPEAAPALGIKVKELTPELAERLNLQESDGVIVEEVTEDSTAAKSGLMVGDIIREINHQPINSVEDFRKVVAAADKGAALQLFIWRVNGGFMVIKLTK